uniref:MAM and LDL-receptor class A domain-containing protein 1-like n=1 Tax=Doryrhamphus excisus TaxID=161450 RepID=UPI0025AE47E7|nr:MAM and LDL-receptor class A domain-containing protein 1-like [Doryrhamphus excisus]
MLGGFHTDLLVTATLLLLTQTGTQCRAENDWSPVTLPDWRTDAAEPGTTENPPETTPSSTLPSHTLDPALCPINCDFEKNLCGWQQLMQDSFDWTRYSSATPTNGSGPNHDHTTGAGFYLYIEGDSVTHGDSARLLSSECHYNGPACLNFWYHMYGSATAMALNMHLLQGNKATKIWSMKNNQGQEWHPGKIDINVTSPFQVIVEGIRGSDALSDVAIDDISIHFGACSSSLESGNKPPSTAEVLPSDPVCSLNCSFDSSFCRWNQMSTDAFDWTWKSGSTPTLMTGPSADHSGDGHYVYIEASSVYHGDTARLISSECSAIGPQCLQFWYHMYGSADTMGLHVYLLQGKKADAIWWKRNDQGNKWHLAQVDLTATRAFQIIIEGRRGSNEESDVAIDDVMLYHGQCSELSDVVTPYPPKPDGNATAPPHVTLPVTAVTELPAVNVTDKFPDTAWPPVANATLPPIIETTDFIKNVTEAAKNIPQNSECPINCDFEKNLCGWQQLMQDSFDWTRYSSATPTNGSGPNHDHTTGAGFYLYIEGDSVTHGDSARLLSSECHYNGPACLNFWYHMYGSATAMALNMHLLQGNKATKIWSMKNNQGQEWHPGKIDINVTSPFQVIVEGIRGSDALSDVAIDDISIHFGACSSSLESGNKPPSTAEVLPSDPVCSLNCSFDSSFCRWNQMSTDAFDWTWKSGSTPTLMTGPSADHSGDGHYVYIEASSVYHGDTARLISSECSAIGPQCLQFWYHMYGSADTMGLHVYLLQGKKADAIWWKRNDQGNKWHLAQVDLTATRAFQIIIEGRRGSNEESDVAIDDVMLYHGQCSELSDVVTTYPPKPDGNATAPPHVTLPVTAVTELPAVNVTDKFPDTAWPPVANATLPPIIETTDSITQNKSQHSECQLSCNFEKDLCQWSQLLADAFDWTRHSGATPSLKTGPSSDHTTGHGHYLYTEASGAYHGDTARLISSECSATGPQCLQFWYHMYGSADTMGLHVYLLQDKRADAILWMRNNQGNMWRLAQVDFTTAGHFQILFEGRRGSTDRSDVAIDDVSLYRGRCADLTNPTLPPSVTTDSVTDISNVTQPQNANSTSTTTDTTGVNPQTTATPKTPNPNASTTMSAATTDHQVDEGTEEPEPEPTAEEITTAITYPETTAAPLPTGPHPQTSMKPETPLGTVTQPTTTDEQQSATSKPQHPNGTQPATTARPQLPTTAGSTPPCPQHSHYTACISACSPTCRYINGPPRCNDTEDCEPGCECDDGYVLRRGVCVPVRQCGCVDADGNKYSFGQVWYTSRCSHKCECQREDGLGEIDCDEHECDDNAVCLQNDKGDYYCQKTGFDTCLINGDPEYRTFDNMKHDFEGEHSYVLVRSKNLPGNLPDVYIEGNNAPIKYDKDSSSEEDDDDDDDNDNNSSEDDEHHRLHGLTIKVYNHTVEFKKGQKLFLDGKRTKTPVSPSLGLKILKKSSHIYAKTDFGLKVKFDGRNDAEITLPRVYKRKVGGLCGNFDGRMLNDRMKPDGTMAKTVQEFGESWRV